MNQGLYLFVTSERPDQYLNPILHCLQNKNLDKIIFIQVENGPEEDDDTSGSAKLVHERVKTLFTKLADEGKYIDFSTLKSGKEVDLKGIYQLDELAKIKGIYTSLKSRKVDWLDEEVDYYHLQSYLSRIYKNEPTSIFDVSAVGKEYLGDIIAIGVIEGISTIHSFKLYSGPNFKEPWKSLFPDLVFRKRVKNGYNYVNLTKRPVYVKCSEAIFVRRPPLIISLFIATVLLVTLTVTSLVLGQTNWFIVTISSVATIASILSAIFTFLPSKLKE